MNVEFTRNELKQSGFRGFCPLAELAVGNLSKIPEQRGLYLIYRDASHQPDFLPESPVNNLRPNTTVPLTTLNQRWVEGAHVREKGTDLLSAAE